MPFKKGYCADAYNSPPREKRQKQFGSRPCNLSASAEFVLTEELQQIKLQTVLSSYWSFSGKRKTPLKL